MRAAYLNGDALNASVIVVGNGIGHLSSNPWRSKTLNSNQHDSISKLILFYIQLGAEGFGKYIRGAYVKFPDFFVWAFKIVVDLWKFSMLLLYILWDDWPWFYDFKFKSTATAAIGIHPTKAWLSQLVNFKKAMWTWGHIRRTICNKMLF